MILATYLFFFTYFCGVVKKSSEASLRNEAYCYGKDPKEIAAKAHKVNIIDRSTSQISLTKKQVALNETMLCVRNNSLRGNTNII